MDSQDVLIALLLDIFIGDPYFFPHPVKLMGKLISFEERVFRKIAKGSHVVLKYMGGFMVLLNASLGLLIPLILLHVLSGVSRKIFVIYSVYACVSGRMLHYEASKVKKALETSLRHARKQLSYIVGRDTSELSEGGIISATIETVAENTSDGIIAPLLYIFLFGVPGGYLYKFVNTMDSMVGYKNDKYEFLGFFPAIIDDIFNFIPARITGFILSTVSVICFKSFDSFRILIRDRKAHLSPNAGFPEAAVAGALGIQLGGGHSYFGVFTEKPTLGDKTREVNKKDIDKTIILMYLCSFVFVVLLFLIKIIWTRL